MPRIARVVLPGVPHHVTQRGNRRGTTFFEESDYRIYLQWLDAAAGRNKTEVWAYCLMPNHVHLVLTPATTDGLRATLGELHRRYTRRINDRFGWRGHLWQDRFASFPLDEEHLSAVFRYVELNPVRASLVSRPEEWAFSSAGAHLRQQATPPLTRTRFHEEAGDWRAFLDSGLATDAIRQIRRHEGSGRPLGSRDLYAKAALVSGMDLHPRKPGRPPLQE